MKIEKFYESLTLSSRDEKKNTLSNYNFMVFFSGLVDCLNDEDCLGAERKCFRNITLHEGKCVCNEGYKQAKEDPIKCLSIGMYIYDLSLHCMDFFLETKNRSYCLHCLEVVEVQMEVKMMSEVVSLQANHL